MVVDLHALKLGPDGYRKIAIIGSAPSSMRLGPYNDPDWAIWGCSPGVFGEIPRKDVWWEIHRWEPPAIAEPRNPNNKPWFSPEYVRFIQDFPGVVMLAGPDPEIDNPVPSVKNGVRFPFEDFVARYGDYFFTSTMAWMLALAIDLWGVDMSHSTEYGTQRPGCQHFMGLATQLGIPVVLPPESDLAQPPPLYGICEYLPRHMKNLARLQELEANEAHVANQLGQLSGQLAHIRGALDNHKYWFNTWIGDRDPGWSLKSAVSLAGVAEGRPAPAESAIERFEPEPPQPSVPAPARPLVTHIEDARKPKKAARRRK